MIGRLPAGGAATLGSSLVVLAGGSHCGPSCCSASSSDRLKVAAGGVVVAVVEPDPGLLALEGLELIRLPLLLVLQEVGGGLAVAARPERGDLVPPVGGEVELLAVRGGGPPR